jgi:periplasmic protein TonB
VADNTFRHVVEPFAGASGNRKYTVPLSIVAHSLVIAAAIIVPLVATDTLVLPTQLVMQAFPIRPPLPPSPPRPRGVTREVAVTKPPIPLEAPATIAPEIPIQSDASIADLEQTPGLVDGGDYSAPPPTPALPRPVADVPVRVSIGIKPPVKVKDVGPLYPAIARAAHVEGVVIIEATIGRDGKVRDARILRSIQLLDAAALDAVRQWEYNPTLLNGAPVSVVMTVTVNFKLR